VPVLPLTLAAISAVLVWLMIRYGALDHPVARSSHDTPIPKGGGVGIAAAYAVGSVWLLPAQTVALPLVAALGLSAFSYADDVRPRAAALKLVVQFAAACAVVLAGERVEVVPMHGVFAQVPLWFGLPMTICWLLFITNAVNFMDGLNGLASGSVFIAAGAACLESPSLRGQTVPLLAGIAGFLPFNFPRARIFMGDVGSQLCGFVIAMVAVQAVSIAGSMFVLPLALLPMLADVAFTLARRALTGDPLMQAHRSHLYQVAHRAGMSAPAITIVYWVMAGFGAWCGTSAGWPATGAARILEYAALSCLPFLVWTAYVIAQAKRADITRW
jgi:UDP-GlcNAc:undecaprenyl-phosphate GlcNAc-1-phosphate transferase